MATNVVCADTGSNNWFGEATYEVMCQYDAVQFIGESAIPALATEDDVTWWSDYEELADAINDKGEEMGIDPWTACPEIDWSDLGAAMERLAEFLEIDRSE